MEEIGNIGGYKPWNSDTSKKKKILRLKFPINHVFLDYVFMLPNESTLNSLTLCMSRQNGTEW